MSELGRGQCNKIMMRHCLRQPSKFEMDLRRSWLMVNFCKAGNAAKKLGCGIEGSMQIANDTQ